RFLGYYRFSASSSLVGRFDRAHPARGIASEVILILKSSLACFAISMLVGPVWAGSHASIQTQYLALGDSLAFGYSPLVQPPDLNQYVGYARIIAGVAGLGLANA